MRFTAYMTEFPAGTVGNFFFVAGNNGLHCRYYSSLKITLFASSMTELSSEAR